MGWGMVKAAQQWAALPLKAMGVKWPSGDGQLQNPAGKFFDGNTLTWLKSAACSHLYISVSCGLWNRST